VQRRLELVFTTFLQVRSASKVLRFFNEHQLLLPRRDRFGHVVWKPPTVSAIIAVLKNPAYAGAFVYGRTRTIRTGAGPRQAVQKKLPMEEWRIRLPDKYPAYIGWETYEQIQARLQDNHAEYDRNKTRGVPRPGAALLHGIVYCGECGHKMVLQYKQGTRYLCNQLRQQYRVPVCQYLPADPVDAKVVETFFAALSPIELDAYKRAMRAQQQTDEALERAHAQQIERLRYQAALAQRQFHRVDPDNRLVAAELEQRWEAALHELKQAEEAARQRVQARVVPAALPADMRAAFTSIGQKLPEVWHTPLLSRPHKKALLRCLLDKVVIHRTARDRVHTRLVWQGGDTTTFEIPIAVHSLAALSCGPELEQRVLELHAAGKSDPEIAEELTAAGFRSPMRQEVLVNTVKLLRLKHRLFVSRAQSHPRRIAGCLTVPQMARALDLSVHWLYDRIHNGRIQLQKNPATGLYLFPDHPTTLERLKQLRDGHIQNLRF
jgi:hypothetical protein